ncbi:MAG: hypothetical protein RLZZ427_438, partial [Pseudomonadota bacterium]
MAEVDAALADAETATPVAET